MKRLFFLVLSLSYICAFPQSTIALSPSQVNTATSISQYGITWYFDKPVQYGTFANGDYWVVGPVTIIRMTPDRISDIVPSTRSCNSYYSCPNFSSSDASLDAKSYGKRCNQGTCEYIGVHHGWEVNPVFDLDGNDGHQAFDGRIQYCDPELTPTLPYEAQPGESIVKAISLVEGHCNATGYDCLNQSAVLTVLKDVPPNSGATLFRPPYSGDEKPLYSLDELKTNILPSYPTLGGAPSLEWVESRFKMLQMWHEPGSTGTQLSPIINFQEEDRYGPKVALDILEGLLVLMSDYTLEEKMPALINFMQMGIDWIYMVKQGKDWTVGGRGVQPGFKVVPMFAAVMLDKADLINIVSNTKFLQDINFIPRTDNPNQAVYGTSIMRNESAYWKYIYDRTFNWDASRTIPDPYGYIDSEIPPLSGYALNGKHGPWKGQALIVHLMPELKSLWNNDLFLDYVDRSVNFGRWTQPDPCAPVDESGCCQGPPFDNYTVTFGPDPNNPGECIKDADPSDGTGRIPHFHGAFVDGSPGSTYASDYITDMWDKYRPISCYDGVCEGNETAENCAFDCAPPCHDSDQDGWFSRKECNANGLPDCNDIDPSINPAAVEICDDYVIDNDCDGKIDCNDGDCKAKNYCKGFDDSLLSWLKFEDNLLDSSGKLPAIHAVPKGEIPEFIYTKGIYVPRKEGYPEVAYGEGARGRALDLSLNQANRIGLDLRDSKKLVIQGDPHLYVVRITDLDKRLSHLDEFTISMFAKKNNPDDGEKLIFKGSEYELTVNDTSVSAYFRNEDGVRANIPSSSAIADIHDTNWHLYTLTYDGSILKLYVDAVEIASKEASGKTITDSNHWVRIGYTPWGDKGIFDGYLDEIKIYDRALSKEEIQCEWDGTGCVEKKP